jgi:NSS family neurotransmitter:Na+ symporter
LNAAMIALFVGWRLSRQITIEELGLGSGIAYRTWRFLLAYVAPLAILAIFVDLWF